MDPEQALNRIAFLLERSHASTYRVKAFRHAALTLATVGRDEVKRRCAAGTLTELPGVGEVTAEVVAEAVQGATPTYLQDLEARSPESVQTGGEPLLALVKGDVHTHSDWSDGGSPIEVMARTAMELGRDYIALTDHSPRLTVARGLTAERLRQQLDFVAELNTKLEPFRILTGIEVDILDDGRLDQEDELLARVDIVVASVHSKLRMPSAAMTRRMVAAIANPHTDILGHCTGRMVTGKGRPASEFESDLVFEACRQFDVAVEVNSRPERLDPPRVLLREAVAAGCLFAIDSDAHAPGQLDWLPYGCARAVECDVPADRVVTTWDIDRLLEWTTS